VKFRTHLGGSRWSQSDAISSGFSQAELTKRRTGEKASQAVRFSCRSRTLRGHRRKLCFCTSQRATVLVVVRGDATEKRGGFCAMQVHRRFSRARECDAAASSGDQRPRRRLYLCRCACRSTHLPRRRLISRPGNRAFGKPPPARRSIARQLDALFSSMGL